ncbi:Gfo/Idh/MocA family protein [Paenibacillus gansuensis]|uniref:Gfo/Idh/MocA family protein n=1 Tax=Paenibacillus gansuensis TaxID=306542 RepID=A0ABW5P7S4_9BACL
MGPRSIGIGMIGYQFMGKAHSHAYRDLPFYFGQDPYPAMKAIAGRDGRRVAEAAQRMGWDSYETDWRVLLERADIDVIDICTPNASHAEIAIAAAEAGKHILCEKPLALNASEAWTVLEAVRKAGVIHMICHNYRFAPAVLLAKKLITEGKLGRIYHLRATYLQDWLADPFAPYSWRMSKAVSGSGAHGDLASHSVDLARFLLGEIRAVSGLLPRFVSERPDPDGNPVQVDVDDASIFMAEFACGAAGTFEATRYAGGNRNGNRFEINGERGSLRWDMEKMNQLEVYFADDPAEVQGFRSVSCTENCHPYGGTYWPAGHIIGYEHTFIHVMHELVQGIERRVNPEPNFGDGLRNQLVLDAVEESSTTRQWVDVQDVEGMILSGSSEDK